MKVLGMLVGCVVAWGTLASAGEKLEVGPGKKFETVAAALKAAKDGDTVEIDAKGKYEKDVGYVNAGNLTIRGVGEGRAVLDAQGTCAGRKGIFVVKGKDVTVENLEFRNAGGEVNAAGIRVENEGLTVRNCKFFECRDAILGGSKGLMTIEHNEFSHCGHNTNPATHNLYVAADKLVYRFNYSHHSYEGHLLKTRAKESWLLYNRLSDEDGTGSAVADFPDGGVVVLVGNVLHKGPKGQNNRLIAYGMESTGKHPTNALYVVNNTLLWDNRRGSELAFVHVKKAPEGFTPVIRNNVCIGTLRLTSSAKFEESGNLIFKTAAEAGFVDPEKYDFRLKPGSPLIDKGVDPGRFGDFSLAPEFQYLHSAKNEKRPADGKLDVGACEAAGKQ